MTADATIRAYYAAFNRGDWDGMCALLTEDVAHDVNQSGREHGRAAFRAFLDRMARAYREEVRDLVVMATPDATRAAAEFTIHGTYLADEPGLPPARGQGYVLPVGAFFALRGGLVTRVTNFYDLNDWLRQVR